MEYVLGISDIEIQSLTNKLNKLKKEMSETKYSIKGLERTIDEVLTDEIFEQLYFLGRKPEDYFIVDVSLSGHAPGTFAYGDSGRKTVQDRRQTHISVKRIPSEEYGNYLLTS